MLSQEKGVVFLVNVDVRLAAAGAGVRLWQIADALGLNDGNFSRKLRHELSAEEKSRIIAIIKDLSANKHGGEKNAARD